MIFLAVSAVAGSAAEHESLEQLITRADAAPEGQKPDLYLEIAEREVKVASDSYSGGKAEDGRAALQQVVSYADKAHALVLKSGKKLPHTEIKIRRMAARLRDLKRNVEADEQTGVQAAIDKLETFRTDLLQGMFGPKKESGKKLWG